MSSPLPRPFRLLLLVPLLACGPAAAEERDDAAAIERLLEKHAATLGRAAEVKTLAAELTLSAGTRTLPRVESWWQLPGRCARQFRYKGRVRLREHFGPEGAFVFAGTIARHRPRTRLTRGGYYLQKALATPFPLLDAARAPETAARGLRLGHAKVDGRRHPVLSGPPDEHGVRRHVFLDPKTHRVDRVRYEIEENRPFAEVVYAAWTRVDGVTLPTDLDGTAVMFAEEERGFHRVTLRVRHRITKWLVDASVESAPLVPAGRSTRRVEDFGRRELSTGPAPADAAVGDLDGDGAQDIAVACFGGLAVHFGGSLGKYRFVELGAGSHHGCAIDDLDGDGHLEVVTMSWTKPPRGLHAVAFDEQREPRVRVLKHAPERGYRLALHDLDRDGIPDLVATGYAPPRPLAIRFGNGAGGVRVVGTDWPLDPGGQGRAGQGLAIGRVDGDALADIAVVDTTRLLVFQGRPNGAFLPRMERGVPLERPVDVVAVDLDLDGRDDFAVVNDHPPRDGSRELVIVRNTGATLRVGEGIEAGAGVRSVAAGRLDGDRFPDLAVSSYLDGEVRVFPGDGKGGVAAPVRFAAGRGTSRVVVADVDGDGRSDVVAVNRLDDTVTVHENRRAQVARPAPRPARARATGPPDTAEFVLEGLADTYDFAGSFRLPLSIPDPSGVAFLGGDAAHAQLVVVSDKKSALFRATLDRRGARLLVGPAIPLEGLEGERLDLEGLAWDREGTLFLGCEADGTILRATVFGQVLGRAETGIPSTGNDGIEGVALRRKKDGTPVLYVLKERFGAGEKRPFVRAFDVVEEPFALRRRDADFFVPVLTPDQTGATFAGDRMIVVGRLLRRLIEFELGEDDRPEGEARSASLRALTDGMLRLTNENPLFGVVEGVAADPERGDLFLVVDNNRSVTGRGEHRGRHGRLLWFRSRTPRAGRARPGRVRLRQVLVPHDPEDPGAVRARARRILERVRAGDELAEVAKRPHGDPVPAELVVVARHEKPRPGELAEREIPEAALRRLAFRLEPGEVGLVEYDKKEAPRGWRVVQRIE